MIGHCQKCGTTIAPAGFLCLACRRERVAPSAVPSGPRQRLTAYALWRRAMERNDDSRTSPYADGTHSLLGDIEGLLGI